MKDDERKDKWREEIRESKARIWKRKRRGVIKEKGRRNEKLE